jgi:hypothetical protein
MSSTIPDPPPATSTSSAGRRRRLGVLLASLVVAAAAVGTGAALASRPSAHPATATAAAAPTTSTATMAAQRPAMPAGQGTAKATGTTAPKPKPKPRPKPSATRPADTARGSAVLPDGVHHALIRRVDAANDRITVDVVQLFVGDAATKAAIEDGKSREQAEYVGVWLRNQSPRLRTLPLAADLRVDFFHPCDESPDRRVVLERLASNARLGQYFYSLTVRGGVVHALKERQINPAC